MKEFSHVDEGKSTHKGPTGGYRKGIHIRKASPIHNEILIHTVLLVVIEDPYTPIAPTGRYRKALPIHTKSISIGPTGGYRKASPIHNEKHLYGPTGGYRKGPT